MINRAAVLLRYKKPAVKWINEADPVKRSSGITIDSVNAERTVYLIRDEDADSPDILNHWIQLNYKTVFENELEGWYVDESLWPKDRGFKRFNEWFEIECHSVIVDTVDLPIEDDET